MTPFNRFIHLIKYFKNNFIFFIFFGSLVGISEYLLITNVYELYLYFLEHFEYKIVALIILITAYAFIIFIGLFLIFLSQRQAFLSSLNYVHHIVLQERPLSFIRNPEELTRALNIERERLAREIISPLQNICIKIALPIAAIFVVLNSESINPSVLVPPFLILILAFLLSSSMFAIYAKKLEKALSNIGRYTFTFVKTFDSNLRFKNLEDEKVKSKENIYHLASTEGFIDSFSQLPRHAIDFCIFGLIVYGFLWESSSGDDLLNIVVLSPLFLRAISSIQAIYKGFASIRSNIGALNILGIPKNEYLLETSNSNINRRIEVLVNGNGLITVKDKNIEYCDASLGICLPSGTGKTNAILNSLHFGLNLPTTIEFSFNSINKDNISYISGEPFFDNDQIKEEKMLNKEFLDLFNDYLMPSSRNPLKCSMGELFRWNLFYEMSRDPSIIVIDESIVHVGENQQKIIMDYFESANSTTSLIIISHSVELIERCKIKLH